MSQLALDERWMSGVEAPVEVRSRSPQEPGLCAACRTREARYGFRDETHDDPAIERPRTLCFECFRVEIGRRQEVAARLGRGSQAGAHAKQVALPLEQTLESLSRRRRRAQIAARRTLGVR